MRNTVVLDAINALRTEFGDTLPAVLITADRSFEVKQEANSLGIPILQKPIKPASLRAMIEQERVILEAAQ